MMTRCKGIDRDPAGKLAQCKYNDQKFAQFPHNAIGASIFILFHLAYTLICHSLRSLRPRAPHKA